MKRIIEAENISKNFGSLKAVDSISFSAGSGEIFGIIGADGAGKTTLFRILTTLSLPDSGDAFISSMPVMKDFKKIRRIIGYMPGTFGLYTDLTVEENIEFFASIYGTTLRENYHIIKDIYLQIEPFKKRKAADLSGGMKQKLALCCALVHKPEILFLDEPTTGVDPVSRREFWGILKNLQKSGMSVLASTPYMDEADMCDRIALMHEGSFLTVDTPKGIISGFHKTLYSLKGGRPGEMIFNCRSFAGTESCFAFGDSYHIVLKPGTAKESLIAYLEGKGYKDLVMEETPPGIEDCFMEFLK